MTPQITRATQLNLGLVECTRCWTSHAKGQCPMEVKMEVTVGQDNGMDAQVRQPQKSLVEADALINGQRQDEYGSPESNFTKIAVMWGTHLGIRLTEKDVAAMMVLLKVARGTKKRDNWLDIIGYAAIAADQL